MFKEFSMVLLIIIVHELGHLTMAHHYKWNFDKIAIYPFGGCCKFDEKVNRSLKEELMILLSGPLFQVGLFFIISIFQANGLMTFRNFTIFKTYHYTLLIFNLLPIYPLDGGRILNIVINYIMPYKKGNKLVVIVSFLIIVIMMFFYRNLNFTLMGILLTSELFLYFKRQDYLYNRMLLERYMDRFCFKRLKTINNKDSMYKERRHIILFNNKYITEREYLKERFRVK